MAEIQLVDVGAVISETPPPMQEVEEEGEEAEEAEEAVEVAPPVKRGRGRPPGAKNRQKPVPEESAPLTPDPEPLTLPIKKRAKKRAAVYIASEESADEAPPPPRKKRSEPIPAPDSPRTHRHKALQHAQQQRVDRHAGRVQEYSSLLHEMLAY